jgi:hypothetical protein
VSTVQIQGRASDNLTEAERDAEETKKKENKEGQIKPNACTVNTLFYLHKRLRRRQTSEDILDVTSPSATMEGSLRT